MNRLCLLSLCLALVCCFPYTPVHALNADGLPGQWELALGGAACPAVMTIDRQAVLREKGLQCVSNTSRLALHDMKELDGNQLTMHLSGNKPAAARTNTKEFGEIFIATITDPIDCVNGTQPFKFPKGEVLNFFRPVETTVINFSKVFSNSAPGAGHSEKSGHGIGGGTGHNLLAAVRQILRNTGRLTVEGGAKKSGAAHGGSHNSAGGHNNTDSAKHNNAGGAGHSEGGSHSNTNSTKHNSGSGAGHSGGGSHSHSPTPCGIVCQQQSGTPVSGADAAEGTPVPIGLRSGDTSQIKGGVAYMAFGSECLYKQTATVACFPTDAQVSLRDGRFVAISDVKIGDEVSIGNGKYSRVFFWTHYDKNAKSEFVRLTTESGHSIEASVGHYVYSNTKMVPAGNVRIGDVIPLSSGSSSKVVDVSFVVKTGLFNPQTLSGDIAVNGIIASTYTEAVDPTMAHALLTPLRMVTRTITGAFFSMKPQTA